MVLNIICANCEKHSLACRAIAHSRRQRIPVNCGPAHCVRRCRPPSSGADRRVALARRCRKTRDPIALIGLSWAGGGGVKKQHINLIGFIYKRSSQKHKISMVEQTNGNEMELITGKFKYN